MRTTAEWISVILFVVCYWRRINFGAERKRLQKRFVGGGLLAMGLFSRAAAFIMSGEVAIGYFVSHAPHSFFPILNRGDAAILYCFVFLYFAFADHSLRIVDGCNFARVRPS